MSQIAETRHYAARAKRLLDENDRKAVRGILSIDPLHGAIIPGSGGVRKMRFALPGAGKSGGVRIIHYYKALDDMVFLLDIYAKKQKENLTRGEINEIKRLVGRL